MCFGRSQNTARPLVPICSIFSPPTRGISLSDYLISAGSFFGLDKLHQIFTLSMAEQSGVTPEGLRSTLQEKIQAIHVDIEDMSGTTTFYPSIETAF